MASFLQSVFGMNKTTQEEKKGNSYNTHDEKYQKSESYASSDSDSEDDQYQEAERITLVMDNLNTHTPGAFYETFCPDKAKALWDRFEFVYTPKHGSWLNMAEIELNVLISQCLGRRIDNIEEIKQEVSAWQKHRNNKKAKVNWQFTADDARIKLSRLYPTLDD